MGNKAILNQAGDGTAIPAGMVGEMLGTLVSGTGAKTYYDSSTTVFSVSNPVVLTRTLNKGTYLVTLQHYCTSSSAAAGFYVSVYLGAASFIEPITRQAGAGANLYANLSVTFPLIIDADGTELNIKGTGQATSSSNKMWILRIA